MHKSAAAAKRCEGSELLPYSRMHLLRTSHASIIFVFEIGDPAGASTVALFLNKKSIVNSNSLRGNIHTEKVVIEKGSTARVDYLWFRYRQAYHQSVDHEYDSWYDSDPVSRV